MASYEILNDTDVLGRMALERMLAGLSARHYDVGLEPVGEQVTATASGTSKSAVSWKFVAATETALAELPTADLSTLDLVAFMVDGVHVGEHCCVVALGIGIDGTKHLLALAEGSTENATLVTELIVGLREQGLDVTRPIPAVLDGSKALRCAVVDVFDHPVIQRCELHKIRNVADKLPEKLRSVVQRRMRDADHAQSALAAQAQLETLAGELDRTRPGATASLREGLAETLTVPRLAVPPTLAHDALHQRDRVDDLHLPRSCRERETLAGCEPGGGLVAFGQELTVVHQRHSQGGDGTAAGFVGPVHQDRLTDQGAEADVQGEGEIALH